MTSILLLNVKSLKLWLCYSEEETPQVAAAPVPAPDEPMDVNTAVQLVLKKALAHDGVSRGLNETARALEKGISKIFCSLSILLRFWLKSQKFKMSTWVSNSPKLVDSQPASLACTHSVPALTVNVTLKANVKLMVKQRLIKSSWVTEVAALVWLEVRITTAWLIKWSCKWNRLTFHAGSSFKV